MRLSRLAIASPAAQRLQAAAAAAGRGRAHAGAAEPKLGPNPDRSRTRGELEPAQLLPREGDAPTPLPPRFAWEDVDWADAAALAELCSFLSEHYVGFDVTSDFVRWVLERPGAPAVSVGVRHAQRGLVAYAAAMPTVRPARPGARPARPAPPLSSRFDPMQRVLVRGEEAGRWRGRCWPSTRRCAASASRPSSSASSAAASSPPGGYAPARPAPPRPPRPASAPARRYLAPASCPVPPRPVPPRRSASTPPHPTPPPPTPSSRPAIATACAAKLLASSAVAMAATAALLPGPAFSVRLLRVRGLQAASAPGAPAADDSAAWGLREMTEDDVPGAARLAARALGAVRVAPALHRPEEARHALVPRPGLLFSYVADGPGPGDISDLWHLLPGSRTPAALVAAALVLARRAGADIYEGVPVGAARGALEACGAREEGVPLHYYLYASPPWATLAPEDVALLFL
eukprot:tig00022075_g23658.t1